MNSMVLVLLNLLAPLAVLGVVIKFLLSARRGLLRRGLPRRSCTLACHKRSLGNLAVALRSAALLESSRKPCG